jgi:hypothetical protein
MLGAPFLEPGLPSLSLNQPCLRFGSAEIEGGGGVMAWPPGGWMIHYVGCDPDKLRCPWLVSGLPIRAGQSLPS